MNKRLELNLVYSDNSDIKYNIQSFPDGQQNVIIHPDFDKRLDVVIFSRLRNFKDLEIIIATTKSLNALGVKYIHLYTPYFLGARSDRKFEPDKDGYEGNNYLKDVICPIVNSLNFKSITVLDPHSNCLEMGLNNFNTFSNLNFVKWSTRELYGAIAEKGPNSEYPFTLIAPDAGATHKIFKLANSIGYKGNIVTCTKERNTEGNLTEVVVPLQNIDYYEKDFVIIDDICDGGRTFINIAKAIKETIGNNTKSRIFLIITHGIFSSGFSELTKYFDGIFSTNSYADFGNYAGNNKEETKLTQLNVF